MYFFQFFEKKALLFLEKLFLFYFFGGYFLYSALFAAVGAAVDNETDTQQFMIPITAPLGIAYVFSASIIKNPEVKKSIKKAERLMNGYGRILVRASGTESKIRVMGESENKKLLEKCLNIILAKIK